MTDRAAELREALEGIGPVIIMPRRLQGHQQTIIDAARTIALPILEADEALVERVAKVLFDSRGNRKISTVAMPWFMLQACAVLAALIPEDSE